MPVPLGVPCQAQLRPPGPGVAGLRSPTWTLPQPLSVLLERPTSVQAPGGGLPAACRTRLLTFCAGGGGAGWVSGRQPGSFRPRPGLPVGLQQEPLGPGRDREDAGQSARAATSTHHRSGLQNARLLPRSPGGWTSKVKGPPPLTRESSILARRRPPLCAHQLRGPGDLRPHS